MVSRAPARAEPGCARRAALALVFAFGLTGCPSGSALEDKGRFALGGAPPVLPEAGAPELDVACEWEPVIAKACALANCHRAPAGSQRAYAGLILSVDEHFATRLKDVPATLGDLDCSADIGFQPCEPGDWPPECDEFAGDLLVDSRDPDESFLIKKIDGIACGNQMPLSPGSDGFGDGEKACLESVWRAIAALP